MRFSKLLIVFCLIIASCSHNFKQEVVGTFINNSLLTLTDDSEPLLFNFYKDSLYIIYPCSMSKVEKRVYFYNANGEVTIKNESSDFNIKIVKNKFDHGFSILDEEHQLSPNDSLHLVPIHLNNKYSDLAFLKGFWNSKDFFYSDIAEFWIEFKKDKLFFKTNYEGEISLNETDYTTYSIGNICFLSIKEPFFCDDLMFLDMNKNSQVIQFLNINPATGEKKYAHLSKVSKKEFDKCKIDLPSIYTSPVSEDEEELIIVIPSKSKD